MGFGDSSEDKKPSTQGYERPGAELYGDDNTLTQIEDASDEETGKVHVDESSSEENSRDSSVSDDHEMTEQSDDDNIQETYNEATEVDLIEIETIKKPNKPKF